MTPTERAEVAKEVVGVFEKYNMIDKSRDRICVLMAVVSLTTQGGEKYTVVATPTDEID